MRLWSVDQLPMYLEFGGINYSCELELFVKTGD